MRQREYGTGEITVKDVDVAFDQIAMKYDYAFNVMTDEKIRI